MLVLRREVWTRFAAAVVFAGLAGWTIAALLRFVLGSIDANFWGVAGGLALGALRPGCPCWASARCSAASDWPPAPCWRCCWAIRCRGLTSAPELLPSGWGALGQWLPQGANATLLRSTAFFGGAGRHDGDRRVLAGWAIAGAVLIVIAAVRNGKGGRLPG